MGGVGLVDGSSSCDARSAFGQAIAGTQVRNLRDQLLLSCAFQYASTFWLS